MPQLNVHKSRVLQKGLSRDKMIEERMNIRCSKRESEICVKADLNHGR
ncbi:MAG: hypothetical protein LBJ95_02035 [Oscillospiraceae bacterium]|nr:hypothetical protein [Oscillospiraceae bacterium]